MVAVMYAIGPTGAAWRTTRDDGPVRRGGRRRSVMGWWRQDQSKGWCPGMVETREDCVAYNCRISGMAGGGGLHVGIIRCLVCHDVRSLSWFDCSALLSLSLSPSLLLSCAHDHVELTRPRRVQLAQH